MFVVLGFSLPFDDCCLFVVCSLLLVVCCLLFLLFVVCYLMCLSLGVRCSLFVV